VRTSRLEALSDGVLAIIITIMVLGLKVPAGPRLSDLVQTTGVGLLTYLLSFVHVAIYWNNHHHMFHLVKRPSGAVLWANLALLFCLSLFPFTTAWMDESRFAPTPVVIYGLNLLAAAIDSGLKARSLLILPGCTFDPSHWDITTKPRGWCHPARPGCAAFRADQSPCLNGGEPGAKVRTSCQAGVDPAGATS
jgi:hypothetical protein